MSLSFEYSHPNHSHKMNYNTEYQQTSIELQHQRSIKQELIDSHYTKHTYTYPNTLSPIVPFLNSSKSGSSFPKSESKVTTPQQNQASTAPLHVVSSTLANISSPSFPIENYTDTSPRQQACFQEKYQSVSVDSCEMREMVYPTPLRSTSRDSSYNLPRISPEKSNTCTSPQRSDLSRSSSYTSASNWSPSPSYATPPPSLPPLSETLNNIFEKSPKKSALLSDSSRVEGVSTHSCAQYPPTMSSLAITPRLERTVPSASQILPPLGARYSTSPQHQSMMTRNSTTISPSNQYPTLPSMAEALTMDRCQSLANSQSLNSSEELTKDDKKMFSFVSLPGVNGKKRPRRRFDEIERLYSCNYSGCTKSYGTLNHLNAHVMMQKHGVKRLPNEFKELRKNWKKQKQTRHSN